MSLNWRLQGPKIYKLGYWFASNLSSPVISAITMETVVFHTTESTPVCFRGLGLFHVNVHRANVSAQEIQNGVWVDTVYISLCFFPPFLYSLFNCNSDSNRQDIVTGSVYGVDVG